MAQHSNQIRLTKKGINLFFLTGLPKTGSTWLMNMLNDVPELQCMGEGRFFSSGIRNIPSLYDCVYKSFFPWVDYIAERKSNWLDNLSNIKTIEKINYVTTTCKRKITQELVFDTLRQTIQKIMTQRSNPNTIAIGDKTPTLALNTFSHIFQTFPDSKIIFLHRGLYDFLASYIMHFYRSVKNQRPDAAFECFDVDDFLSIDAYLNGNSCNILPSNTLSTLAKIWHSFEKFFKSEGQEEDVNILRISYEDLRSHTPDILAEIVEFLISVDGTVNFQSIVEKWGFDSSNMSTSVLSEHINSREMDYGKSLFSEKLNDVIDEAIRHK